MDTPHSNQRPVRILPPALADRIAAGEVVERPASVVKELVENSLDAGATRVDVTLEQGGVGRILVCDDGHGLPEDELLLAVTRHATSKLAEGDDLLDIGTFGFRGEALASIAAVADVTLSSAPAGSEHGAQIRVVSGQVTDQGPSALAKGTRVDVRDLFGAVPARRKFLKTAPTEVRRCQEVLSRLSLAHPEVGFSLTSDGRSLLNFPQGQNLPTRLAALWPPALTEHLEPFEAAAGGYRVRGLAGPPSVTQARGDRIYTYVNDRPVQDRILTSAVRQAYSGRLISREHPVAVIFLDVPEGAVDVNVHPSKVEVRFRDESAVFSVVRRGIVQALAASDPLMPKPRQEPEVDLGPPDPLLPPKLPPQPEAQRPLDFTPSKRPADRPAPAAEAPAFHVQEQVDAWKPHPEPVHETQPASIVGLLPGCDYLGQVADTYLILRLPGGDLGLLDQHAAHERVLYARFRAAGTRQGRSLAVPVTLPLHGAEQARLDELWADLAQLGFGLSRPSPGVVEMTAAPGELTAGQAKELLAEILAGQVEDADALWQMYACRAALKAGEALAPAEALALIGEWAATEGREHCPHGRPALVKLRPRDLEKLFKRS